MDTDHEAGLAPADPELAPEAPEAQAEDSAPVEADETQPAEEAGPDTDRDAGEDSGLAEPDEDSDAPDAPELTDDELERSVAALLFASPDPISIGRLRNLTGGVAKPRIEQAFGDIAKRLADSGLPWELRPIAGGWQFYTTADMAETVLALSKVRKDEKVSPASLETLAVVAYRQPVTKAEIEAIRGVQVGPVLRAMVDRGLVKVAGRADVPGHPLLYETTKKFLEAFGLMALDDLPRDAELLRD